MRSESNRQVALTTVQEIMVFQEQWTINPLEMELI